MGFIGNALGSVGEYLPCAIGAGVGAVVGGVVGDTFFGNHDKGNESYVQGPAIQPGQTGITINIPGIENLSQSEIADLTNKLNEAVSDL